MSNIPSSPSTYHPNLDRIAQRGWHPIEELGRQVTFVWDVIKGMPHTVRTYRKQTMAAFVEMSWGERSFLVGGGIAAVLAILGLAVGGMIGILGVTSLDSLGLSPLSGLLTANGATRELVPMVAAVGFAAQAGCRMTAEIGSMRISEEIDALKAQGIVPIPFVVGTRVIAALSAIVPFYLVSLCLAYLAARGVVSIGYGQSSGAYDRYFEAFINAPDVGISVLKVIVFAIVVTLAHTYYGYYASGGPEGVGIASGKAIRASLVLIVVVDMVMSLIFWGLNAPVNFA